MNLFALAATESGGSNAFVDFLTREAKLGTGLTFAYWHVLVAMLVLVALIVVIAILASKVAKKGKRQYVEADETIDVSSDETEKPEKDKSREYTEEILAANSGDVVVYESEDLIVTEDAPQKEEEKPAEETEIAEEAEPEIVEKSEPEVEEEAENEVADKAVEEKAEDVETVVKAEEEKETAAAVVEEEPKAETKPARAKKPAAKKAAKPVAEEKKAEEAKPEAKEAVAVKAEAVADEVAEEKPEGTDSKISGKFEICNSDLGGYNYLLRANNGQLLYESKAYKSIESCREAINNFIEAVKIGRFTVRADKFKNYKFILKSPTSNTLLYIGESFSTETSCKNNIESVKRFAAVSPVVDITEEDFVAKFVRYEIPEAAVKAVEEGTGAVGKWEIAKVDETSKTSPFVYLLFANNGQLLYESRDYKTYNSCLNGLKTFVNTVKNGYFVIDPDKSGRYKFVLRSQSANSPMEYYGQNYDTQRACASSIESVYHFALRSPVPEN